MRNIFQEIMDIMSEELYAEENSFAGLPACPTINGREEVARRIEALFMELEAQHTEAMRLANAEIRTLYDTL